MIAARCAAPSSSAPLGPELRLGLGLAFGLGFCSGRRRPVGTTASPSSSSLFLFSGPPEPPPP
eukprot:1173604-Prorocentrum_minimum.AAC.1